MKIWLWDVEFKASEGVREDTVAVFGCLWRVLNILFLITKEKTMEKTKLL